MTARKLLELQSDRIEMVLASHRAPVRVTGGVVTPRAVQFDLAPFAGTRLNKVQSLAEELALALGAPQVRIARQGGSVQLELPRADARSVRLLPLMSQAQPRLSAGMAVAGLCDDGAPLLIRLFSPDVAHILISGTTGSGKTALCQTLILSLALTHRRSQLQFVLIDPKRRAFAPLDQLPHLLRPVIGDAANAAEALNHLVRLMETRGHAEPHIVVALDELADLMHVGGKTLSEPLLRLVQRGREAGIHVVACTQKPSSQVMGTLVRANFPVRLVGKVVSPEDARVAAGIGGTGAEKLAGRGDFIAVGAGHVVRFQAAYASGAEMAQAMAQMCRAPRWGGIVRTRPSLMRQAAAWVARG